MTCQEVTEFLAEYLDQTLAWRVRLSLQVHLLLCRDCRRYLDSYRKTTRAIFALKDHPVTAETNRTGKETVPADLVKAILAARGRRPASGAD